MSWIIAVAMVGIYAWWNKKAGRRLDSVEKSVEVIAGKVDSQGDSINDLKKSVDSALESVGRLERAKAATTSLTESNPRVFAKSQQMAPQALHDYVEA